MATFWVWAVRNPFCAFAALIFAAGATGVLEWGFALTVFSVLAIIASSANHLAFRSSQRTERKAEAVARQVRIESAVPRRSRFLDYVDDGETPYEKAA
jgi:hypothetical protein